MFGYMWLSVYTGNFKKSGNRSIWNTGHLCTSSYFSEFRKSRITSPLFEIKPELTLGPFILWVKLCLCVSLIQIINKIKEVNTEYKNKMKQKHM